MDTGASLEESAARGKYGASIRRLFIKPAEDTGKQFREISCRATKSPRISRDKYRYFACLLRARFEDHKDERDMVKATKLLKSGEEEFWKRQHTQPYIFPDSPGGTSYERYDCYKVPQWCLDHWHPSEKSEYPDYFAKREQWKKLREESWEKEVQQLLEETPTAGPKTEALPPARKPGHLPPLWWQFVTRPRERPT